MLVYLHPTQVIFEGQGHRSKFAVTWWWKMFFFSRLLTRSLPGNVFMDARYGITYYTCSSTSLC